jgi:hypothetical protein
MMAKRTGRKYHNKQEQQRTGQDPFLSSRSGLIIMGAGSLAMIAFVVWQLSPTEGFWPSLLWGLGFALSLWVAFALAYAFNKWVRKG